MFGFFREEGRIKTLLLIYREAKRQNLSDDEALALVIEEHILPGTAIKVRKSMTGSKYISNVFDGKEITIHSLIKHIICLESPKKYPLSLDIEAMRERSRKGTKSPEDILIEKIHHCYSQLMDIHSEKP
jgi:hypothetical protein|tara:strand:+ start:76 stop:462 length:387 start_codon:yes stop_codon:yes gene_type:complete